MGTIVNPPANWPRSSPSRSPFARLVATLLLAALATSCTLVRLKQDRDAAEPMGVVFGPVVTPSGDLEHVYVLLYRLDPAGATLDRVDELGEVVDRYLFPLDSRQRYRVVAFQDLNGDLSRSADEPAAVLGSQHLTIAGGERRELEALRLTLDATVPETLPLDLRAIDLTTYAAMPITAGEVTALDNPRFSREQASAGMWTPLGSTLKEGAGVYFLEEYDAERIPVLFVHGVGGTPTDFRYFIEHLDRNKYQVWVYCYPSGARLEPLARVLKGIVRGLHAKYGFDTLYVTAHSMGGLVARSFVLQTAAGGEADFVKLFVSVSTPYNGHEGAAKGVKYLPAAVPCWLDMQPDSPFLVALRKPFPAHVPFYLLFGHHTEGFHPGMNYSSDSVVSVRSQLAPFAQEQAVRTWGYDQAHVPILSDPDAFARYASILDARTAELAAAP